MRKKSHIALTAYLIRNLDIIDLKKHKCSFYIGSLLPDCVPSFLTKKHSIEVTFHNLKKEIENITIYNDISKGIDSYYFLKLGVITHFVADYFTFPHNSIYEGNLSAHCYYEKELKYALKDYIKGLNVSKLKEKIDTNDIQFNYTVEEICNYIKEKHNEYLKLDIEHKIDCEYIIKASQNVVDYILEIYEHRIEEMRKKEAKAA